MMLIFKYDYKNGDYYINALYELASVLLILSPLLLLFTL